MKELTFIISRVTRKCPFSKKIIKPKTMLCLFNKYQYNNFVTEITNLLSSRLPDDIINIIIDFTNYKKLLNKTGLEKFVNWIPNSSANFLSTIRLKNRKNYLLIDTSDSDSDSNSDLSEED
jgi:hypothetical protein